MKKSLLITAMMLTSITVAQAQLLKSLRSYEMKQKRENLVKIDASNQAPQLMTTDKETAVYQGSAKTMLNKRAAQRADEVTLESLYGYPIGSLFYPLSPDWRGYSVNILQSYAYVTDKFYNYSTYDSEKDVTFDWSITTSSRTIELEKDEKNNGVAEEFFGYYPAPVLTVKQGDETATYQLGEQGIRDAQKRGFYYCGTDSLTTVSHASYAMGSYSGFSNLDKRYESLSDFDGKKVYGFAEFFEKPTAATYVSSVGLCGWIDGSTNTANPFGDNVLTAEIYTIDADGNINNEPYATATAGVEDYSLVNAEKGNIGIVFEFREEDPLMGVTASPIMLPESEFVVILTGFENLDGHIILPFSSAYPEAGHSYVILEDGSLANIGYKNQPDIPPCNVHISLEAAMVTVVQEDPTQKILFPVEGGLAYYDATDEAGNPVKYNNIFLESNVKLNEKNDDNPWDIIAPDWVVAYELDDKYQEDYWVVELYLEAEPLPAGVAERTGEVVISAYGRELVIPVTQGDPASGVSVVKNDAKNTDAAMYNMAGQRVSADFKGLVIKNGSKFMNK